MSKRLEITVSEELWDRLEVARRSGKFGAVPRAAFVKRALEQVLGELSPEQRAARRAEFEEDSRRLPPLSPRTSEIGPGEVLGVPVFPPSEREVERAVERKRSAPPRVPGVVRASSLVKQGVKPIPKKGER